MQSTEREREKKLSCNEGTISYWRSSPNQMALFSSSPRSRSVSDQLPILKIKKANTSCVMAQLHEQIGNSNKAAEVIANDFKTETETEDEAEAKATTGIGVGRRNRGEGDAEHLGELQKLDMRALMRTISEESTSSIGPRTLSEDVCHCDDCFLGITDLLFANRFQASMGPKKVSICLLHSLHFFLFFFLVCLENPRKLHYFDVFPYTSSVPFERHLFRNSQCFQIISTFLHFPCFDLLLFVLILMSEHNCKC